MAQLATVISQQTQRFGVTGDMGNTAFITTGLAQVNVAVSAQSANQQAQNQSFRLLVDPAFTPTQFRKATGIVSVANVSMWGAATQSNWAITDTAASLDDESGKVELRFDLSVMVAGTNTSLQIAAVSFQVTTLAAM